MSDQVFIKRDNAGEIDDLTAKGVGMVRLERLDKDQFWLQIDNRRIYLTAQRGKIIVADMDDAEHQEVPNA